MNTTFITRLTRSVLPVALLVMTAAWQAPALAATNCAGGTCVFGGTGNDAMTNEEARQSKEQWNETQRLRAMKNQRNEKDFSKYDNSIDLRDKCEASQNINAYWEPNTERCLDRRTGRQLLAP
ncbi:DUF1283 family protein [Rahnella aquatilis]|uniref:DUF1283 family protein n=1 Tax=Rahnella aquatilis TaxID=34038 RepID=UPI000648016D|nr:DUF1283 family protein [Rahnella aquatilis]